MTAPPIQGPRRCAIYTRKSTTTGLEKDFTSLDAQREACELFIRSQVHAGWVVLDERYDDGGFTGANLERPGFQKLMRDIEAGEIDLVIVYKIDRLSRSLLDFARVMERLSKHGTGLVSITQNFSTTDAMGRLTLNMLMSFAEYEREMIAERTRDKISAARRRGKWTGGLVPLGYRAENGKLFIEEEEATIVREVFTSYVEHRSLFHVVETLRDRGRKTKAYVSKTGNVRAAKAWTKHSVLRVLHNPVVAGLIHSNGTFFAAEHEPIVSAEEFHRVKALLSGKPAQRAPTVRNPAYLLRGVVQCGRCGATMTPGSTRKDARTYRYYRCLTREKQGPGACASPPLPARPVEELVIKYIREFAQEASAVAEIECVVHGRVDGDLAAIRPERQKLVEQIGRTSARVRALSDEVEGAAGKSHHAHAALLDRLEQAAHSLQDMQKDLSRIEREVNALETARAEADWVVRTLSDFDRVWAVMTPENRGRLVDALVDGVVVDDRTGAVSVHLAVLSRPLPQRATPAEELG